MKTPHGSAPVQQQVQRARPPLGIAVRPVPEQPVQVRHVPQQSGPLAVPCLRDLVVDGPQHQPARVPVVTHALGEPRQLLLPHPPVVVAVAVAVGQRGVQPGHGDLHLGHLEQGPRPLLRHERRHLLATTVRELGIEPLECLVEVAPLQRVRRYGVALEGLLGGEVGARSGPADVVVARNHHDAMTRQPDGLDHPGEELPRLLELARGRLLGQVAGDHHQIRPQPVDIGEPAQVLVQAGDRYVMATLCGRRPRAVEPVSATEAQLRHVQDRQFRGRCVGTTRSPSPAVGVAAGGESGGGPSGRHGSRGQATDGCGEKGADRRRRDRQAVLRAAPVRSLGHQGEHRTASRVAHRAPAVPGPHARQNLIDGAQLYPAPAHHPHRPHFRPLPARPPLGVPEHLQRSWPLHDIRIGQERRLGLVRRRSRHDQHCQVTVRRRIPSGHGRPHLRQGPVTLLLLQHEFHPHRERPTGLDTRPPPVAVGPDPPPLGSPDDMSTGDHPSSVDEHPQPRHLALPGPDDHNDIGPHTTHARRPPRSPTAARQLTVSHGSPIMTSGDEVRDTCAKPVVISSSVEALSVRPPPRDLRDGRRHAGPDTRGHQSPAIGLDVP